MTRWYLDASVALHAVLPTGRRGARDWMDHVAASGESIFSSALLHLEMARVLRREGIDLSRGKLVTDRVAQISIEDGVLRTAAAIELHVKTLDAIHLATASLLGYDVTVATHDAGMWRAAEDLGFDTIDPIDTTTTRGSDGV